MKSFAAIPLSFSLLAFLPSVLAHGRLKQVTIGGQTYVGPKISETTDSVIRVINDVGPVLDTTSDDMSCGHGAAQLFATQSAAAKAGDAVQFDWTSGADTNWPHNTGVMMTYLASCNGPCSSFKSLDAKWTKIDEAGRPNNATSGPWILATTLFAGKPYEMNLPSDLPDGEYLLRHEVLALHNAQSQGLAEFYPSCTQITVTGGSGNAKISVPASEEVSLPGAYSPTDPGILIDVYSGPVNYQFPGPVVETALTSGTGSSGGSSGDSATTTASDALTTTAQESAAATTSAPASATNSADGADCTDGGSGTSDSGDAGDAGAYTVTQTITVTITPTATAGNGARTTVTMTATATATAAADDANVAAAAATTTLGYGSMYPRRISRIMGRKRHM